MKVRITVGDVEVELDGMELSKADITRLFKKVAMTGVVLANANGADSTDAPESTAEPKDMDAHVTLAGDGVPMFGFTRWLEGDPEIPDEEAP